MVDYGNTKIISMHVYPRIQNVAEELKMVTYATPSMEERRTKKELLLLLKTFQNTEVKKNAI